MDRQAILNDLKKEYGSFPTISDISRYLKISRASVRDLMYGVECLPDGRSKKYFGSSAAAGCNELSAGAVMCAYFSGLKQQ